MRTTTRRKKKEKIEDFLEVGRYCSGFKIGTGGVIAPSSAVTLFCGGMVVRPGSSTR